MGNNFDSIPEDDDNHLNKEDYEAWENSKIRKKSEIISIFRCDIGIGFICRRSVVYGCAQGIENGWIASKDLHGWSARNFKNRKEAIEWLVKKSC